MGILSDLDKKLTDNMYEHGSELTDAVSDLPRAVVETVDRLMPFIQPEAREAVRSQVLGLVHEYRIENPSGSAAQD
ncbi:MULTISPECIES: hypothetical protein [unclassified Mesorhizobium]|uniref:hypothetical protein n=1 Tax=unclassified Mesorhizobium TaxID=325217 RepID=UPI0015E3685B|nr:MULTISPECIES: hypothetical protein [unclassified Mesorhizobium]MBZ9740821.1 hypothetical protein [Mesorhizobium sp. CO1-1-4]MBZ9804082.1 hypothetical protein [Mesorhizobium sp. ES1-6]MBZ9996826.1 hypothetical protein [Mesorhizobium sp. BH1-1-4]